MANKLYSEGAVQNIADAIRQKNGLSSTYKISQMAQAILDLPSGGGGGLELITNEQRKALSVVSGSYSNIGSHAFTYCSNLTTVNLTGCTYIGSMAFASCSNLTTVNLPDCKSLNVSAFTSCSNLTTISLPECTTVSSSAFRACGFTEISLPKCNYIGTFAFYSCTQLSKLYIGTSNSILTNTSAFVSTPFSTSSYLGYFGSIYVPSARLSWYKGATNWKAYSARLVGY